MKKVVGGGIGVVVVAGLIAICPQLATTVKDYMLEMDARERSAQVWEMIDECEEHGGRWWKGDCEPKEVAEP